MIGIEKLKAAAKGRENKMEEGYWCVICNRFLPADEYGVIVHDDIPHPADMTFDDEENPQ